MCENRVQNVFILTAENRNGNGNFSLDTIFIGILMYNNENHLEK